MMPCLLRNAFITLILFHVIKYAHGRYNTIKKDRRVKTVLTPMYHEKYLECPHRICTHAEDYPEKEIKETLTKTDKLEGLFGLILNSSFDIQLDEYPITTRTRLGFAVDVDDKYQYPESLCETETLTIKPKVMRNHQGHWKFIVNVGQFHQSFVSEFCRRSNGVPNLRDTCYEFDGAACSQAFQEMFLLTFHNGIIDFDLFMIPTTCKCDSCMKWAN